MPRRYTVHRPALPLCAGCPAVLGKTSLVLTMRTLLKLLTGISFATMLVHTSAEPLTPTYGAYPVKEQYTAATTKLVFKNKQDREFQSQLRRAAKQRPNFAGHYILTTFGCGASCVMGAIIDATNGRVKWLPFTVCCWDGDAAPIDFRRDSALIVIRGMRNEQGLGTFYYTYRQGRLQLIAERPE